MVDVVALASVLSSGAVALGGLWVGYRQTRLQQRHELTMAYEERVWAEKSESLLRVSSAATRLADAAWQATFQGQTKMWAAFAVTAVEVAGELNDEVARLTAYASEDTRVAFELLRADLNDRRVPVTAIADYAGATGDEAVTDALLQLEAAARYVSENGILDPTYARPRSLEVVRLAGIDLRRPVV